MRRIKIIPAAIPGIFQLKLIPYYIILKYHMNNAVKVTRDISQQRAGDY